MPKKSICLLLCAAMLLCLLPGCFFIGESGLRAAVVYSGGEGWKDTLYALEQSPALELSVEGCHAAEKNDFSSYDLLYLDDSLLDSAPADLVESIMKFTEGGGAVFLPNGFCSVFPGDYLGISEVVKLDGFCTEPEYPACGPDVGPIQQLLRDFAGLYRRYTDFEFLQGQDYGFGVIPTTAEALMTWDSAAVYTLNRYGEGYVFLTNPMLPGVYSCGSMTMEPRQGTSNFASTTASFDRLLLGSFAQYVSMQQKGYALERVYGYFGTPSMAWELHYEEITGIQRGAMQRFSELCREYDQIPSYTLIRSSYTWHQRTESVTFLRNQADSGFEFQMDLNESAYSSGTHIDAGGQWLTLNSISKGGSYFSDYPEYDLRAYSQAVDLNSDGLTDILCGSADGKVYFYEGTGFSDGRLHTKEARVLDLAIDHGGFAAPHAADLDGDGYMDLVCGWDDGKVRCFSGDGSLDFSYQSTLADFGMECQALPAVGDVDGDGAADLIVGSDVGRLMIYSETASMDLSGFSAELGDWLAPAVIDWNRDGVADLAVGVYHGYVALILGDGSGFAFNGYITADEMNYKGNHNLKFGNWAAPSFADLDGDGQPDLICGSQEYGIAYPIDSPYFPYRQQLQEQVDYAAEHDYYLGVHFYTNAYASPEREAYELQSHRKALESYGADTSRLGANQHTWYTSSLSGSQTMSSLAKAGILWQSGFAAPRSAALSPQAAAECVVSLPHYLVEDGSRTLLVQNTSVLLYNTEADCEISARYRMPVCIFYHCDFVHDMEEHARNALTTVQGFREQYGYNFNREDQMMLSSAAALHQQVRTKGDFETGITIHPMAQTGDFALSDRDVSSSLGVRVLFSESIDIENIRVDADVWYWDGRDLVLGLNRNVKIVPGKPEDDQAHIRRINMAAAITPTDTGSLVEFHSGGMMECSVAGAATTDSPGWKTIQRENETIFIKFGSNESLNLIFKEDLS